MGSRESDRRRSSLAREVKSRHEDTDRRQSKHSSKSESRKGLTSSQRPFNDLEDDDERRRERRRRKRRKREEKRYKEEKEEKRQRKRERQERNERSRSAATTSEDRDSEPSYEDGHEEETNTRDANDQTALEALKSILKYNDDLQSEVYQLAEHLDGGHALDISGLEDTYLLKHLHVLLSNIPVVHRSSGGYYLSEPQKGCVVTYISQMMKTVSELPSEVSGQQSLKDQLGMERKDGGAVSSRTLDKQLNVQKRENTSHDEKKPKVIGPAMPPPEVLRASEAQTDHEYPRHIGGERVNIGPQAPPSHYTTTVDAAEKGKEKSFNSDDSILEEDSDFIGPLPTEIEAEVDEASLGEQADEIKRILRIIRDHCSLESGTSSEKGKFGKEIPPNPYDILEVPTTASSSEIKKRYLQISLKVHPDKCSHPDAPKAFQAISSAAKELQDKSSRAAADKRIQEMALRHQFASAMAQQERKRQWAAVRPGSSHEVTDNLHRMPFQREAWMTELPPDRQATGPVAGRSTKSFNSRSSVGTEGRNLWTRTPKG